MPLNQPPKSVLGILGRGIQKVAGNESWTPTEDLEVCATNGTHLTVRVPADDENPHCMVGGGELNFLAGMELYRRHNPSIVVCAYGHRAEYLSAINAPSESNIMGNMFQKNFPKATIEVWPENRPMTKMPNTNLELRNIFELAKQQDIKRVDIVTIDLHMPRVLIMGQRHLSGPDFIGLNVKYHVSEQILKELDPTVYGPRREALRTSKSFQRTWGLEQSGISKILKDAYEDERITRTAADKSPTA